MFPSLKQVTCPICSNEVLERVINEHIDSSCIKHTTSSSQESISSTSTVPERKVSQKKTTSFPSPVPIAPIFKKAPKRTSSESQPIYVSSNQVPYPEGNVFRSAKRAKHTNHLDAAPLAEKLRPDTLSEFIGQGHITGPGSLLLNAIANGGSLGSVIFWGPPGCGKTTLARLFAKQSDSSFKELSATVVGVNEVRAVLEEAKNLLALTGRRTILFLDEVHRFNRAQQDIFLPYVEQGHIQLVGATTENPSFRLTGALLSRCRVYILERLTDDEIKTVLINAVNRIIKLLDETRADSAHDELQSSPGDFLYPAIPQLTSKILSTIISLATGDARIALSLLEHVLQSPPHSEEAVLVDALGRSVSASYNRSGESHYDMISALHKSVRGSQGSAAMYWLARMLVAGEDPLYIARRMVVCASEDIGLADKHALPLAMATFQSCQTVGMPECRINLAHLVAYLSEAPKSTRAYEAYNRAEAAAKSDPTIPVPMQMRNAPTKLMEELGYGKSYYYNPDYAHPVYNTYLPVQFDGEIFLREAGDRTSKRWDEDALRRWETEVNGGRAWEGRASHI